MTRDGHLQQRFKYPYILVPTQLSGYHKAKETKKNVQLTAPDIVKFSGQMQVAVSSPPVRAAAALLFPPLAHWLPLPNQTEKKGRIFRDLLPLFNYLSCGAST